METIQGEGGINIASETVRKANKIINSNRDFLLIYLDKLYLIYL